MEESVRTAIFYSLDVLNSDSTHSSIPVGLHLTKCGAHPVAESYTSGSFMRWLLIGGGREYVTTPALLLAKTLSSRCVNWTSRGHQCFPPEIRIDTELMELSCRRAAAQLEQLIIETETTEPAARRIWTPTKCSLTCRPLDGLNDQGRAPDGPAARAAVTTAEDADDEATDGTATEKGGTPDLVECRLRVVYGDLIEAAMRRSCHRRPGGEPKRYPSPPEYFGANPQHLTANAKEFRDRQKGSFCFSVCHGDSTSALLNTRHGKGASAKEREDLRGASRVRTCRPGLLTGCARGRVSLPPLARRGGGVWGGSSRRPV